MAPTAAIAGKTQPSEDDETEAAEAEAPRPAPGRKRAILLALAAALLVATALGVGLAVYWARIELLLAHFVKPSESRVATGPAAALPLFLDLPDMVVNLTTSSGDIHMLRASIALELASPADAAYLRSLMPRIQDVIETRLRALRPDDLKGTAQYYRLRDELLARVAFAVGPGHVRQVFFKDLIVR
ncbi:MAG TPA: flagellar basal body-associated FliL family protein [Alphaproteobacteria bacterium]|nr:flagellar basal body-associated FliL family protein [Alphaproteobacteria bacterium]